MTISIRLSEEDTALIKAYAKLKHLSMSELIRQTVLEKIENEYDLKSYENAITAYKKNPVTYSHEDVVRILELD